MINILNILPPMFFKTELLQKWTLNLSYNSQQSWLSGRAQNSQAVDQSSRLKQH